MRKRSDSARSAGEVDGFVRRARNSAMAAIMQRPAGQSRSGRYSPAARGMFTKWRGPVSRRAPLTWSAQSEAEVRDSPERMLRARSHTGLGDGGDETVAGV